MVVSEARRGILHEEQALSLEAERQREAHEVHKTQCGGTLSILFLCLRPAVWPSQSLVPCAKGQQSVCAFEEA